MKIGYPCINRGIGCTTNSTFRLANYSKERLIKAVTNNIDCLQKILVYNVKHDLLFFRISSDIIPFASHPICKFKWEQYFEKDFANVGEFIKKNKFRISMHPDQFILINAKDKKIVTRSVKELAYHCTVLDLMGLDNTAKVQIHIGGVYGDKEASIERFIKEYKKLPEIIKKRLAIENDHNRYSFQDCLRVYQKTKIPIIFDSFHHECLNNGETMRDALLLASKTWKKTDGVLMVDYSSQEKNKVTGAHAQTIDICHFKKFLQNITGIECDIMLEIKDKEKSAHKARQILK